MRYRFGESAFASASRFLSEIGEEKLEVVEGRSGPTSLLPGGRRGMAHHPKTVSERAPAREEQFFADESPDYENDSQESFEIKQGTAVRHEMFGKGKVIRVTGKGDAMKAVVDFDDYGVKNLLVKFARLRPA
jgi:DNA helicase-2/ATP-dependent DNA helicase PcrA